MPKLTQEKLKELLFYDPWSGRFGWFDEPYHKSKTTPGAGCIGPDGYLRIRVLGRTYAAGRLAWLYMKGYDPVGYDVDHIDRNKSNNRFENLRLASRQCNSRNTGNFSDNTSGIKGVYWHKPAGKWIAMIALNKKNIHLGIYWNFDNAVCARLAGEQCLKWSGCDSCSPAYQYVQKMLGK